MYIVFSLWWLKPAISYLFIYLFPFYFLFFPTLKYTWLEEKNTSFINGICKGNFLATLHYAACLNCHIK